ncbi:MAG: DNA polymerase III subunit gamma/tau [Gammaproteobacteria bacterium]
MSSEVLARKYRPQLFADVVGQSHIVAVLQNSIALQKLHHGYIFSGTRGIGKTTIARIFAKTLNCLASDSNTEPCNECSSCREITAGRNLEFIEIDAASRTGVDDMRELLESSVYKPSTSKYRIYLIDEVHMLSKSSFNALLKTLEEPPEHLIFLMATTEIEKVPNTVLSRCLQLNLKIVPSQTIAEHVKSLLALEDFQSDKESIDLIAKSAQGSLRDALTLADQAIAHGNGILEKSEVANFLGSIDDTYLFAVLRYILLGDGDATYSSLQALYEFNVEYSAVLESFIEHFHLINLAKASLGSYSEIHSELAELADPEFLQLLQEIFLQSLEKYNVYPDPRLALESAILRALAFHPLKSSISPEEKKNLKKNDGMHLAKITNAPNNSEVLVSATPPEKNINKDDWNLLFAKSSLSNITKEVFLDFGFKSFFNNVLILLQPVRAIQPTEAMISELVDAIDKSFNLRPIIQFEVTDPETSPRMLVEKIAVAETDSIKNALTENSSVQYLMKNFDAKISISSD